MDDFEKMQFIVKKRFRSWWYLGATISTHSDLWEADNKLLMAHGFALVVPGRGHG